MDERPNEKNCPILNNGQLSLVYSMLFLGRVAGCIDNACDFSNGFRIIFIGICLPSTIRGHCKIKILFDYI